MLDKLKQKLEKQSGNKNGSSKSTMGFDLLYQLSYMSVIASAGVPRNLIFKHSAKLQCSSAEYFRNIELMYEKLQYDYAKACRLVGETAKEEAIKGLLLRFSSSLLSGEPEADFLVREAEAQSEAYDNDYERKLETLKMWADAYVSLIMSAVLVIIIGIVSTMIWKIETTFILGLVGISIMTTVLGVYLIYLMSPKEIVIPRQAGSKEQKLARKVFKFSLPIMVVVSALFLVSGANLGWLLIVAAALFFPIGWISTQDDNKVTKRDAEVGPFLGSLGGVCAAIGTTVKEALGRIDLDAIDFLRREIKRLYSRLLSGIGPTLCWQKFTEETGSELTKRSVGMFCDAINMGGEPQQAGYHTSLFASKIAMLRAKRKTVSSPFRWLCITMHASIVALLIFITEVMGAFGNMLYGATQNMPAVSGSATMAGFVTFNFAGLELMRSMLLPLVFVFTFSDAIAPSIAEGGSRYKFLYNFGITAAITGASLLTLPALAEMLFKSTIQM